MDRQTKIQTVAAAIAAILAVLRMLGVTEVEDITDDTVIAWATIIVVIGTWAYASHWKNNNFTEIACKYTGLMRLHKQQEKGEVDGENFFDDPDNKEE